MAGTAVLASFVHRAIIMELDSVISARTPPSVGFSANQLVFLHRGSELAEPVAMIGSLRDSGRRG